MSACTVCNHPGAATIDALLAQGKSRRSLAREFNLGEASVKRHARDHWAGGLPSSRPHGDEEAPSEEWQARTGLHGPDAESLDALVALLKTRVRETNNPAFSRELRLALQAQAEAKASIPLEPVPLETTPEWIELREALVAFFGDQDPSGRLDRRFGDWLIRRGLADGEPEQPEHLPGPGGLTWPPGPEAPRMRLAWLPLTNGEER